MEFTSYTPGMPIEGVEPLENGRHECVISSSKDEYDNQGNPRQRVVFQPMSSPEQYRWPVVLLTDSSRGVQMAVALADALGIDRSTGLGLDPREITGKRVTVTTRQSVDDQGRTNVWVDAIRPSALPRQFEQAQPAKAAAAKPRTPAAKVAAAKGEEPGEMDDVPF